MIITKIPFRISFAGGGSDLREFYSQHQGAVISTTINKYMYLSTHKFFDEDKVRIKYSQTETVTRLDEIKHPIVREALKKFNIRGALEISSNADVPAGTGLGSSSAFTVGLLHNLYAASGKLVTKRQLAEEASEIEIDKLKEPIGKQDHYAAAFGGLNIIKFNPSGTVDIEPVYIKKDVYEALQNNLLLFYVGEQRSTAAILSEMRSNIAAKNKTEVLERMVELVWDMRDVLYSGNIRGFGEILHKNWVLKQGLASLITNPHVNGIYEMGLKSGAVGGKLLGAGGSGFLLFYCDAEKQAALRSGLSAYRELKFKFENEGSKIIYLGEDLYNE